MQTNEMKIDIENLKKLAPMAIVIGAVLGVMVSLGFYIGGLWGLFVTLVWAFCGGFYTDTLIKSGGNNQMINLGLNGAILAAIAAVVYDVVSGIMISITTHSLSSYFSLSLELQAAVVGALAAIVWNVYRTNNKK